MENVVNLMKTIRLDRRYNALRVTYPYLRAFKMAVHVDTHIRSWNMRSTWFKMDQKRALEWSLTIFRIKYYNQPCCLFIQSILIHFLIFTCVQTENTPIVLPCPLTLPSMETGTSPHHIITNKTCGNIESLKIYPEGLQSPWNLM